MSSLASFNDSAHFHPGSRRVWGGGWVGGWDWKSSLVGGLVRLQSAVLLAPRVLISWECFSAQVTHRHTHFSLFIKVIARPRASHLWLFIRIFSGSFLGSWKSRYLVHLTHDPPGAQWQPPVLFALQITPIRAIQNSGVPNLWLGTPTADREGESACWSS